MTAYTNGATEGMFEFNVGDKVRWQIRNKNATGRFTSAFWHFNGEVIAVDGGFRKGTKPSITVQYKSPCPGGGTNVHTMKMRQLRNQQWIFASEDKDDPKGRLYLQLSQDKMEMA